MSSDKMINIGYQLTEDGNGMNVLQVNAKDLQKLFAATATEAEKFSKSCVNFVAFSNSLNAVTDTIGKLQGALAGMQQAYAAQVQVETQLEVAMRNRMNASAEEIQSIKDLCSAQQELGVIGDEVQLAGAQELATYLDKKESLEELIPVMNDMLAQQYGLNATQENAAQIATMLGKVMQGQTTALTRQGYALSETQEKILKYGDESDRAAVLAQVVGDNVGGMNEALAQTDIGKQKQLENALGDIKEQIGQVAQKILPVITYIAQTGQAISGVIKISQGLKTIGPFFKTIGTSVTSLYSSVVRLAKGIREAGLATKIFGVTLKSVLVTSGIGIAIIAIGTAVGYLTGMLGGAKDATDELSEAEERAKQKADELKQAREQEERSINNSMAAYKANFVFFIYFLFCIFIFFI